MAHSSRGGGERQEQSSTHADGKEEGRGQEGGKERAKEEGEDKR
jgi:hypothetical protein